MLATGQHGARPGADDPQGTFIMRSEAYDRHPGHRVELRPELRRMRAVFGGHVVAESRRTLLLLESGHAPVHYFPRADADPACLEPAEGRTHCPFKGDASYWTVRVGDTRCQGAAWSYEDPFDQVSEIRGYLAFYGDRVAVGPVGSDDSR